METGYDTFLREEKEEILHFLKKQILTLQGLDASSIGSETKKKSPDWTKLLKDVGAKSLNQLLKKVIPRYRPNLTLSTKELTNLRKKIKGWFNSEGTSEKRGDPLIHDDEVPRFKEELRKVMRVRNFEQLRRDILPCVKEIRMQSCKKFVDSMFSKKFWSTFLNKEENRDIKTIWESLPSLNGKILQKKSVKDMVTTVENSSDVYESENEKMQSEDEEEDDFEDLETDFSILPEKAQRGYWAEDDKKEKRDAAQVHEFMDQIDYNDLQMPVQGFSYDSEDLPGEAPFGCSQEAPIRCSQDRPDERSKTNFLDDFWDAWNQRASSKDAFPLTLSQDSHKPAYFSTLK